MPGKAPWFERKFDFSFPVGKYPDIIERLRGTPLRVEERIASLSPNLLTHREADTWSIQEIVGHFIDTESLWVGRLDDFLAGKEVLRPADVTNQRTFDADHNAASIQTLTESFRGVRGDFASRLEEGDDKTFALTAQHPRLDQPMRLVDLCLFAADHDDYHLARITQLIRRWIP